MIGRSASSGTLKYIPDLLLALHRGATGRE